MTVKVQRTERLVRIASRFLLFPSRLISMTQMADCFKVSKTVISDDVSIINDSLSEEGIGVISVDRGRTGGASFLPTLGSTKRKETLESIARLLSDKERVLPGGLIYYGDILFDPMYAFCLGMALASDFSDREAEVVMTSEVKGIPLALFTAHALGLPLAVCRFRNRASDGPAVAVHYPTGTGDVQAMYLGTRQLQKGKKVLLVDDYMRGGSTAAGMLLMAKEFGAEVVGTGVFIVAAEPAKKAVSDYRALLRLEKSQEGTPLVSIVMDSNV
jgi:purine operon repressor